jgi:hypothetical protein
MAIRLCKRILFFVIKNNKIHYSDGVCAGIIATKCFFATFWPNIGKNIEYFGFVYAKTGVNFAQKFFITLAPFVNVIKTFSLPHGL